ncbi:hypothetical protein [Allomesorhizobium alhagi]|uniref:hypothetical protein n=1 Tax=Allomesorhizobium alhagi TaxID=475067 RepID=UPI0011120A0F|nr:hypothetical protein [Mesorhizobium alhagi]
MAPVQSCERSSRHSCPLPARCGSRSSPLRKLIDNGTQYNGRFTISAGLYSVRTSANGQAQKELAVRLSNLIDLCERARKMLADVFLGSRRIQGLHPIEDFRDAP